MKFGSREICDVVFKAKTKRTIGNVKYIPGQPVFYIDTATASTMEQSVSTVYAQGGPGNTKLISWDGEKNITFSVTDALLSPTSLAVLAGACSPSFEEEDEVHVHATSYVEVKEGKIKINSIIDKTAPIFVSLVEKGEIQGLVKIAANGVTVDADAKETEITVADGEDCNGEQVFVDFYEVKKGKKVREIHLTPEVLGGNFYVEASTLFRDTDGKDYPAELTFPNAKIQSNFSIAMSATGDPSTFEFKMDAMPDYTYFDMSHKVLVCIQVVNEVNDMSEDCTSVMPHANSDDDMPTYKDGDNEYKATGIGAEENDEGELNGPVVANG